MTRTEGVTDEKVRAFLVDDHPVVREGIRLQLQMDERIQVVGETDNGEAALSEARATSAKVILMDIMLPGIDGIESTRQLLAQDPDYRVVILSSFGDLLTRAIEAGACGYVLKTATQPELVQAVLQAAGGYSPIDPSLSKVLFDQFAKMSKVARSQELSNRQRDMLEMVARGLCSKEMEAQLFISEATVKRGFRNIFNLLGVNNRAQAVAEAYKRNLI